MTHSDPIPPAAPLDAFLDGIGAMPVAMVAFGRRSSETLTFAARDGGRLARVVLVPGETRDGATLASRARRRGSCRR